MKEKISEILAAGDLDSLMPIVYDELRGLAAAQLRRERPGHSLQPTALANEAYFKLVDTAKAGMAGRAHFFGVAARAMRQVLVEHARRRNADKRGGGWERTTLNDGDKAVDFSPDEILALHRALSELEPRQREVVEYRFFGGLEEHEVAAVMGVSDRTVQIGRAHF